MFAWKFQNNPSKSFKINMLIFFNNKVFNKKFLNNFSNSCSLNLFIMEIWDKYLGCIFN